MASVADAIRPPSITTRDMVWTIPADCYPQPMNTFDEAYRTAGAYFGELPEAVLFKHLGMLDPGLPVLDIGSGQGRNARFLARHGFTIDALDPSDVTVEQLTRSVTEDGLSIRPIRGTFQDLTPADETYGTVLVFGLIPLLDRAEIDALAAMVTSALCGGGLLFVTAFGTWDPAYPRHASEWAAVGANSFRGPEGNLRTYLEPGELTRLFPGLDEIHTWEGLGPEHQHGSGPAERHGMAEAVWRR